MKLLILATIAASVLTACVQRVYVPAGYGYATAPGPVYIQQSPPPQPMPMAPVHRGYAEPGMAPLQ